MKDRRYGNRGMTLETFMKFANDRYRHYKMGVITKQATEFIPLRDKYGKIANVKVESKATVDFLGRWGTFPAAIEAKNSNTDSIRLDRVEEHQAAFMDEWTAEPGTIGIVVVCFQMRRFFAVPWAFWGQAYDLRIRKNDRSTPLTIKAFNQEWTVPKKYSLRAEELLPEWEISGQNPKYGIHYMEHAAKYVTQP